MKILNLLHVVLSGECVCVQADFYFHIQKVNKSKHKKEGGASVCVSVCAMPVAVTQPLLPFFNTITLILYYKFPAYRQLII